MTHIAIQERFDGKVADWMEHAGYISHVNIGGRENFLFGERKISLQTNTTQKQSQGKGGPI